MCANGGALSAPSWDCEAHHMAVKIKTEVLDIRGTITETITDPTPTVEKVVYQKVRPGLGNISNGGKYDRQRRKWVKPTDAKSAAQLARRAKFAAAVAAWHALTQTERDQYKSQAKNKSISAFNAYISVFMR